MRLIGAAAIVFLSMLTSVVFTSAQGNSALQRAHDQRGVQAGQQIFRFDTFGDEQLWTDVMRMHEVIPSVAPATALAVGLKVDVDALPRVVIAALRAGRVDLTNPAVTVALLRLNAVVGLKGRVNDEGKLTSVGITCALCHSSVDDSFAPGIGKRLDGWANTTSTSVRSSHCRLHWTRPRRPSSVHGGRASTIRGTIRSTAPASSR